MTTFNPELSQTLQGTERIRSLVTRANEWLKEVVGPYPTSVRAKWDLNVDGGRELVTLRLTEFTNPQGLVAAFEPSELRDRDRMQRRFYVQYGDLLQQQSHTLMDKLMASMSTED